MGKKILSQDPVAKGWSSFDPKGSSNASGGIAKGFGQYQGLMGTGPGPLWDAIGISGGSGGANVDGGAFAPGPGEQQYIQKLQDLAYTNQAGPSAAELQMRAGMDRAGSQASAMAASQRGVSPALAARLAAMSQSQMTQGVNQQTGILRAQEGQQTQANKLNAMGLLGNQYQSVRQGAGNAEELKMRASEGKADRKEKRMGGMMQGAAAVGALAMSDERAKKNVSDGGPQVNSFLDSLSPKSYDYKNPGMPGTAPGRHYGVMAQDLEKTGPGASMVKDTGAGKMVDPGQGMTVALAALGEINERLRALEGGGSQHMSQGGTVNNQKAWGMMSQAGQTMQDQGDDPNQMPMQNIMTIPRQPMVSGPFSNYSNGGNVPGQPVFGGDHPANDTVPAMLSPGEIVIPRSILDHQNAPDMAKSFVEGILASKKKDDHFNRGGQTRRPLEGVGSDEPSLQEILQGQRSAGPQFNPQMSMPVPNQNLSAPIPSIGAPSFGGSGAGPSGQPAPEPPWTEKVGQAVGQGVNQYLVNPTMYHLKNIGRVSGELTEGLENLAFGASKGVGLVPENAKNPFTSSPSPQAPPPQMAPEMQMPPPPQPMAMPQSPELPQPVNNFQGLNNAKQSYFDEAKVQGDLGTKNAEILQRYGEDLAIPIRKEQQAMWNYKMDSENYLNALKDEKINPNQYIDNMSTGQKVMTGIGLLLGGIGGAMTGNGQNPALNFMNKQIDADIDAQKANMGQKNNLFKLNMEKYKNEIEAAGVTKMQMWAQTKNQLEIEAAKAQGPLAQARAKLAAGQIQNMIDTTGAQTAQKAAIQNAINSAATTNPAQLPQLIEAIARVDPKKAEDMRNRLIPGVGLANTEKDKEFLVGVEERRTNIDRNVKKLISMVRDKGTYEILGPHNADLDTLAEDIATDMAKMRDINSVARPHETEAVKKNIVTANIWDTSNPTAIKQLKSFYQLVNDRASAAYTTRGMKAPTYQSMSNSNEEAKKWLQANPNDPRAAAVRKMIGGG